MKKLFFYIITIIAAAPLWGQVSTIKDIYTGQPGSNPTGFTPFNNYYYFAATDPVYGREIWRTDGTTAGTTLVKDVFSGVESSNPKDFCATPNALYFTANNGSNGFELWMTDGIVTKMVKDYQTGSSSSNAKVVSYYNGNTIVHFNDGSIDKIETLDDNWTLGVYSGAEEAEIEPSHFYKAANGLLYFAGAFTNSNYELYSWDGTTSPQLVADIDSSANSSLPEYFLQWNDSLFYQANDGIYGKEMWKTDGAGNSSLWVDIVAGSGSSGAEPLTIFKNKLVWKTDSINMVSGPFPVFLPPSNTITLHLMYDFLTHKVDTTKKDYEIELTEFNGKLYYAGYKAGTGQELYSWDGINPPALVLDYNVGNSSSNPTSLFTYKDHLFFNATDATGKTNLVMYNGNTWGNVKDSTSSYYIVDFYIKFNGIEPRDTSYRNPPPFRVVGLGSDDSVNTEPATFAKVRTKHCCYVVVAINTDANSVVATQGSTDTFSVETAWNFDNNNIFTAQLSDKNGGFTNPTSIGTMNSKQGGKMVVSYPTGLPQSEDYRIRIIASSPADTSLPSNERIALMPANKLNTCCPINPTIDSIYGDWNIIYTYWQIDSIGKPVSGFASVTVNDTVRFAPDVANPEMMTIKSLNAAGIFDVSQPKYNLDKAALKFGKSQPVFGRSVSAHIQPSLTGAIAQPTYQITPVDLNPFGFSMLTGDFGAGMVRGPIQLPGRGNLIVEPHNIGTFANRYEVSVTRGSRTK